jgi:hypothetical protein
MNQRGGKKSTEKWGSMQFVAASVADPPLISNLRVGGSNPSERASRFNHLADNGTDLGQQSHSKHEAELDEL